MHQTGLLSSEYLTVVYSLPKGLQIRDLADNGLYDPYHKDRHSVRYQFCALIFPVSSSPGERPVTSTAHTCLPSNVASLLSDESPGKA